MTARKQATTRRVSYRSIVASREFALGFAEVRTGQPFNPDNETGITSAAGASACSRRSTCRCGLAAS